MLREIILYWKNAGARKIYLFENSTQANYTRPVYKATGYTRFAARQVRPFRVLIASTNVVAAVMLAYLCELPWLILSDYYFVHLPAIVLFLTNTLWAALIHLGINPIKKLFSC
ncbi:hypothetical protein ER57_17790 [Smithella sp. SCADC]|nr:hypothetical protein ER57_17790 [Smithella sp. SCADC]